CVDVVNLAAWFSRARGCARTRNVLLLDTVRLCTGLPARSTVSRDSDGVWAEDWWWILGSAPAHCSESDGRMIYGVNEAITGMVLRRLEKSRLGIYRRSPGEPIEAEEDLPEGLRKYLHGGV
ncbi:unnamed protein product, partial [Prunus brigantina]